MDILGAILLVGFSIGVALWMLSRVKRIWYQYQLYQMMQGEGEESEFMNQMKSQLQQYEDSEETEEETKSKTKGMYQ